MRILIAGAGIGGLAAALALARRGHDVAVFERADTLGEVGAGIQISPNGAHVLEALGVGAALDDISFRPEAATLRLGRSGRVIFSNPLGETARARYGAWYHHVHRADLHRILAEAVAAHPATAIYLNAELASFEQTDRGVTVRFTDGATEAGDVLIGADGIHSAVRRELFGVDAPRFTGNLAWRLLVPAARLAPGLIPPEASVWTGPSGHAVTYYVRRGELVNFVGVVERSDWQVESWTERGSLADLKGDFAPWCDTIQMLIDAAEDTECYKWALFDRDPMPVWSKGRATLLGDACHPMLPFMAQGACMALEDAWVLSACLSEERGPARALAAYESRRKSRTARVQLAARANTRRFHQGSFPGQLATYGPMWLAARLAPGKIQSALDWLYGVDVTKGNG